MGIVKVKRGSPYVDSMSYWTFTDIFEENGPAVTPIVFVVLKPYLHRR
jgi:beta-xylosidase